jgi:hypothetical protein
LIPVWGIIPKVAIAYSGTYVVGNAILAWYLTGRHLTSKQMKELSAQAFSRGKEVAQRLTKKLPKRKAGGRKRGKLPAPQNVPVLSQGEVIIIPGNANAGLSDGEANEVVVQTGSKQVDEAKTAAGSQKAVRRGRVQGKRRKLTLRKVKKPTEPTPHRTCVKCGKISSGDARFCQYCGNPLEVENPPQQV